MTPRARLLRAWQRLERAGATVRTLRLGDLADHEVGALAADAERRLKVIAEGRAAGWISLDEALW